MPVRQLPQTVINRIAAGEVIERPASVVKELAENAIDAGAAHLDIVVADGGLSLIRVTDDGCGMDADDLRLCIERHATSKLDEGDLTNIATLGFRGEALPSIGSVARLAITTRRRGEPEALEIRVDGGVIEPLRPAALAPGTRVEVRDLFYATPARLKFMKSERAETMAITEMVKRLAMARPSVAVTLTTGERTGLNLPCVVNGAEDGFRQRLGRIMGKDFAGEAVLVAGGRDTIAVRGFAGLPTLNRNDAGGQFLFVNGRPVKDKLLAGAVRGAYADLVPHGRHPMLALFIDLPPDEVDVNVHPAKAEVRFRDSGLVRAVVISVLRDALGAAAAKTSPSLSRATVSSFRGGFVRPAPPPSRGFGERDPLFEAARGAFGADWRTDSPQPAPAGQGRTERQDELPPSPGGALHRPLGSARAQFHENYILAETDEAVIIVDQHAAHERLVYERLKAGLAAGGVEAQALLIPEIVELDDGEAQALCERAEDFARLGLAIEAFGGGAVMVREVPALLGKSDIKGLIQDLANEAVAESEALSLTERLNAICAKLACYGSVRSGRRLTVPEMDALLRQMEATPNSGQCNHGRPTYVELKRGDIERLFGRR